MITATPAPARPSCCWLPQPSQHDRERREPEVRLGLATARRKEQQVDRGAIGVARIREARQVQQQERELERAP
jgi:hypothetical protein